ncbi:MoaD/ThiS family protein [Lignipirellula cremea]|uniref:Sulfur carrier protein ThiS n=1 Tax=Lignipirellula cremea TaxID=2528010 RepID=A0A518DTU1_9BACT|nr:MoaD/ThiS family protein [Lignipirellula cremea]QDU95260.1 sulfur carrier protein ThiS [Lignipirellula cremea]
MQIQVVVTGRSYHLAEGLPDMLSLPDGADLDAALAALAKDLPEGESFPASCLVAVSGEHVGTIGRHPARNLRDGDELVLFAPVAGG